MAGDRVIGSRLSYRFGEPKRGDVIIFRWPDDEKVLFVKRIMACRATRSPCETAKSI